jgi:hypothetical protein
MRPRHAAWNALGYTALLVTLLLSSPGVRVVRADESRVSIQPVASEGPVCSPQQPADDRELARAFDSLRQGVEPRATAPDPNPPVALNNAGYSYGRPPEAALAVIRAQLELVLRER